MRDAYNFSAGPAMLPEPVMRDAQASFLSYASERASVMEISHRGRTFLHILRAAEDAVKALLHVPDGYHVLFLHGGATMQFAAIPMNLMGSKKTVDYFNTGTWSEKAIESAALYATVHTVATVTGAPHGIPAAANWSFSNDPAYVHYTDNETISGVEFQAIPAVPANVPLVSDMSSNIFSRPIDISKFSLIYAGAQKNIGPAGVALVIVRDDVLDRARHDTPAILHYKAQALAHSSVNTPATYSIYLAERCLAWLQTQGGVEAIAAVNRRKADKVYAAIERHPTFYRNDVAPLYRSCMNVTFRTPSEVLDQQFADVAATKGLLHLAGHRSYGGLRASIYNAMPEEGVDRLVAFMEDFAACHA